MMAGALADTVYSSELLSYEGPFGVGYAIACFEAEGSEEAAAEEEAAIEEATEAQAAHEGALVEGEVEADLVDEDPSSPVPQPDASPDTGGSGVDPFVALARASVEYFVTTERPLLMPEGLPPELVDARAGVFVSLHEHGDLRGCIGTIAPTRDSRKRSSRTPSQPAAAIRASTPCRRTSSTIFRIRSMCCSRPSPSVRLLSSTRKNTA